MASNSLALQALVEDIAEFAKAQIEVADLSGPRYGAYLKLAWCGTAGMPCRSDCQSILDALQTLREVECMSELDNYYIAMFANIQDLFPEGNEPRYDMADIRKWSADIAKVA
jgi:hypothetical protein